jgi:hypothetical protein
LNGWSGISVRKRKIFEVQSDLRNKEQRVWILDVIDTAVTSKVKNRQSVFLNLLFITLLKRRLQKLKVNKLNKKYSWSFSQIFEKFQRIFYQGI